MTFPLRSASSVLACGLLLALQLGVLAGCATLPAYPPATPAAVADGRILLDEWLRSPHPASLQGVAKVKVRTPERSISGTQVLVVEAPDRLRAETLSPFGTSFMVMATNGTDMAVLLPGDNLYYLGRATPENLGRFTRLPLRSADLVNILLFRPPRVAYQKLTTVQGLDGGCVVALEAGPRRQELRFDANRRLVGVDYYYEDELQLRLAYGEFGTESTNLPRRIDLFLPLQETEASLIFSELDVDRPVSPGIFTLVAPPGAKVTSLDEAVVPERVEGQGTVSADGPRLIQTEGK